MKKSVRAILIGDADTSFKKLNEVVGEQIKQRKENTKEMQLLKSIKQKVDFLKINPFYGDNIEKDRIPKEYNVQNLWRVGLTGFWRMLYTIRGDQIEIICFILDIMDHKKYNKIFGYKRK